MAFLKRLGFYLLGLSIGMVFLAYFFKKKSEETGVSFCYLPNCRTLKDIRSMPLEYSPDISDMIANNELDTLIVKQFLIDGDVDFGKSDTQAKPCKFYIIEHEIDNATTFMEVKNCEDKVIVVGLR